MTRIRFDGCDLSLVEAPRCANVSVWPCTRLPPALAASATPRILELLGDGPGRVLELGFAGIHAAPLELAGWEVVVVEPDPAFRAAQKRAPERSPRAPQGRFDAVVAPAGADLDRRRRGAGARRRAGWIRARERR